MKLNEIFDDAYYDRLQDEMKRKKFDRHEDIPNDTEGDLGDFIISKFEAGKINFQQAKAEIKKKVPADQHFFWLHELNMADELMRDE
jgi:hypothetical protein